MNRYMRTEKVIEQDDDAKQLRALSYSSKFDRTMSRWENFSLGFTYLSPVVGVYSVFATAIATAGPAMWWTYLIAGLGQFLVSLVFGEVVSQFPISGGLYPWSRRLVGRRWAWLTGWIYGWALFATISAVSTGSTPFISSLLGVNLSPVLQTAIAITLLAIVTLLNLSGTRLLARVAMFGFICELIGAIAVGGFLLLYARHQPLAVLVETHGIRVGGSYWPAFVASAVAGMFCFFGFEACGDVAEETPNASRTIPKTMRMTIYIGGAAAIFVCLALILAIPDLPAVIQQKDVDPVSTTLIAALGLFGFRVVVVIVLVSFISCLLSLQAAASRLLYAYARDEMIAGSRVLSRVSVRTHVPANAVITTGAIAAAMSLVGLWLVHAIGTIISFASAGIYVAFQMLVLAALIARARGWQPLGVFRLGRWALPVNITALIFGLAGVVDIAWPRSPEQPWYINYGIIVGGAAIVFSGLTYMILAKPYAHGNAPAGDAHQLGAADMK